MFNTLVAIPVYNSQKDIKFIIREIKQMYPHLDILVIDDGSTDQTEDEASILKHLIKVLPNF